MLNDFFANDKEGIDLCFYHCGMEDCEPMHSFGPAVRDHFLIHFILDGKGTFFVNGKPYELHKDQGFLICPDVVTYYEADKDSPWHYVWVGFQGVKAETYLKNASLTENTPIFTYDKGDYIRQCFMEMMDANKLKFANEVRLTGLLYLFLSELIENSPASSMIKNNYTDLYIKKSIQYIQSHYSREITIPDISKYLGLNRSYFSTIFKSKLGKSPQEFLIDFRIEKACEFMSNPELSISDIARSVGYNDPLCFSKIFKKIKGVSPKSYREKASDTGGRR